MTESERAYMRDYMRRRRAASKQPKPKPVGGCLECGGPIPPRRYAFCSRTCSQRACNRRNRTKNRERFAGYTRLHRARHPEAVHESQRKYRESHPDYYKDACACGRLKVRKARRCDVCRTEHELTCQNNPNCGLKFSHKHCALCGEPMRRRWDEMCPACDKERLQLGMSIDEFITAAKRMEEAA